MIRKLAILAILLLVVSPVLAVPVTFTGLVVYDDGYSVREGATIVAKNQDGAILGSTTTTSPGLYSISVSGSSTDVVVFYVNDVMADGFATLGNNSEITKQITVKRVTTPPVTTTIQPAPTQTATVSNISITLFGIFPIRTETELMITILLIAFALACAFIFVLYYLVFIRAVKKGTPERDYEKDF